MSQTFTFSEQLMMEEKMFLPSFQYHQVLEKQLIGQGGYGRIYKGEYQSQEVVLKVLEGIDEEDANACKVSKYGVFSGPYFPAFGLDTERYFVSLRIQSKYWKIRTRKTSVFGLFSRGV